jgi:hypothetical protein
VQPTFAPPSNLRPPLNLSPPPQPSPPPPTFAPPPLNLLPQCGSGQDTIATLTPLGNKGCGYHLSMRVQAPVLTRASGTCTPRSQVGSQRPARHHTRWHTAPNLVSHGYVSRSSNSESGAGCRLKAQVCTAAVLPKPPTQRGGRREGASGKVCEGREACQAPVGQCTTSP